ncbi:MAG: hypothetical protein AMXMBFR82_26540 [Candidatus Hydrogenedentota bacterium]
MKQLRANPGERFIRVLGEAGLAISALATFGGIVVIYFVFSTLQGFDTREMVNAAFKVGGPAVRMIPMMFAREITVVMLAVCLFAVVTFAAMLRRKPWSRRAAIGIFSLAIVYVLCWVVFVVASFTTDAGVAESQFKVLIPVPAFAIGMLGFAAKIALLGWFICKLTTPSVRAVFENSHGEEARASVQATLDASDSG